MKWRQHSMALYRGHPATSGAIRPHSDAAATLPLLNPHPPVGVVPIFDGHQCVVLDGFMREPEALVDYAARNHAHFQDVSGNYYPGPELPISGTFAARP